MLRWFCLWEDELPQSRLRRASPLWDGAFGMAAQFPAKAQSLRARQRLPPRGSWQSRQVLPEGVPAKPHEKIHLDCIKCAYI